MSFSENDLIVEVRATINARIDAGQPSPRNWIIQQVIQSHGEISGEHAGFYRVCAFGYVGTVVRKVLSEYKLEDDRDSGADTFPGFEHLQRAYLVNRLGESVVVPTTQLFDREIDGKVEELRRMSKGCLAHAIELIKFKTERVKDQAS